MTWVRVASTMARRFSTAVARASSALIRSMLVATTHLPPGGAGPWFPAPSGQDAVVKVTVQVDSVNVSPVLMVFDAVSCAENRKLPEELASHTEM